MDRNLTLSVNGDFPDNFIAYLKSSLGKGNTTVFLPVGVEVISVATGIPLKYEVLSTLQQYFSTFKGVAISYEDMLSAPAGATFKDKDGDLWYSYGSGCISQQDNLIAVAAKKQEFLNHYWENYAPWKVAPQIKWKKPMWMGESGADSIPKPLTYEELFLLPPGTLLTSADGLVRHCYGNGIMSHYDNRSRTWVNSRKPTSLSSFELYGYYVSPNNSTFSMQDPSWSTPQAANEVSFAEISFMSIGVEFMDAHGTVYTAKGNGVYSAKKKDEVGLASVYLNSGYPHIEKSPWVLLTPTKPPLSEWLDLPGVAVSGPDLPPGTMPDDATALTWSIIVCGGIQNGAHISNSAGVTYVSEGAGAYSLLPNGTPVALDKGYFVNTSPWWVSKPAPMVPF